MTVTTFAVRQRIAVMVLALIILVFGYVSYMALPREATPDITIPYVFVSTNYRGVAASDIETAITIPIEKKLKGLEHVKSIKSSSAEGLSSIVIEFQTGTDIDDVLQKVRNKVDEAKGELPGDLDEDPSVFEVNFSEIPIVVYSLSGTCGNPCLKRIADDLADDIEGITGVLEAEVTGGLEREIRIEVSPEKLAYYGIPITSFQAAVASENQNTSGGSIDLGDGKFQLSVPGEFKDPGELYGLVIGTHQGQPVYLKDLAVVVDGFKDASSRARLDGVETVSIAVKKRAGENIIFITEKIDELVERHRPGWPRGTKILKLMDGAKDIRLMVADLENNIMTGLVLVVVVMLFSLGVRNAVLVSLSIPFSMLMSFMILDAMGITLNNVVLYALTLALGMLVDNAIVIIENIYRHMHQGVPRIKAAIGAASEVAWPIIGSTLTTLAAFSPMMFWPGIMGEFMKYLPITLIVTLSSSLFVALVINPALAAMFMRLRDGSFIEGETGGNVDAGEKPVEITGAVLSTYTSILRACIKHRVVTIAGSFVFLILLFQVWMLVVGLEKPVEFFPDIEPRSAYVNIDMPEGAGLDYADRLVKRIEARVNGVPAANETDTEALYARSLELKPHADAHGRQYTSTSDMENVEYVYAKVNPTTGGTSMFEQNTPTNVAVQFLEMADRTRSSRLTLEELRRRVKDVPGAIITVDKQEEGPPTGLPINIEIAGDDLATLGRIARGVREVLEGIPHVEDIKDDYVEGNPSVRVNIDRQRAAMYGLSTSSIGFALKTGYNGLDVSTYRESDEDYDITVRLSQGDRKVVDVLNELMIPTPTGQLIPLTSLARIDYTGSIGTINRINFERVVTVKANVDESKVPGPVVRAEAEKMLKVLQLPTGYKVRFTGQQEAQAESEEFLSKAFLIALFLIFLILVTMFNSVSQPFIIMTSIILSLGGAFVGLAFIESPFGIIMSGVGVISLAGVVVNNGIVLIDYINKLIERGMALEDAVVLGGATRLRPVALTAITTILGLLPMVTGVSYDFHIWAMSWASESTQWWRTMAIVVIFGLMIATLLTLFIVPTLYVSFSTQGERLRRANEFVRDLYWRPYRWLTGDRKR